MCGIVGVIGNLYKPHIDAFSDLLYIDTWRGQDSTGVMSFNKYTGEVSVLKKAIPGYDFIGLKHFDKVVSISSDVIIGHNRAATKGAITADNAHPFVHGPITGVHNGTLFANSKHALEGNEETFDTDSEAIFYALSKVPHTAEGVREVVSKLDGSYTLVWFDKRDYSVNFIRNAERPLHFTIAKDGASMIFASEAIMISAVTAKERRKIANTAYFEYGDIHSLATDTYVKKYISTKPAKKIIFQNENDWDVVVAGMAPEKKVPAVIHRPYGMRRIDTSGTSTNVLDIELEKKRKAVKEILDETSLRFYNKTYLNKIQKRSVRYANRPELLQQHQNTILNWEAKNDIYDIFHPSDKDGLDSKVLAKLSWKEIAEFKMIWNLFYLVQDVKDYNDGKLAKWYPDEPLKAKQNPIIINGEELSEFEWECHITEVACSYCNTTGATGAFEDFLVFKDGHHYLCPLCATDPNVQEQIPGNMLK